MRVETLTPVVTAAPGARARWRLRVQNDASVPVDYRLRVIGFDAANVLQPPPRGPLEAGEVDELDVELLIPEAFAAGHHSIALEFTPDRAGGAPVIAGVTVTVGSIDDIALAILPSTIRARRRARFKVDIDNRSNEARVVELEGDSAALEIRMEPPLVRLEPGERVRTTGRIKAPRHLSGEPRQHSLTVAARSSSAPSYAPATFQQRALFPGGLRTMLAVLLIVGIWGGALGAGFLWWHSREDEEVVAGPELVDIDGDGVNETPADQMVDTDGDGVGDATAASVAAEVAAAGGQQGAPQPGGSDQPTRTSMGGTVAAADGGQATGVDVTLTPLDVGAPPPTGATRLGFRNGELRELDGPVTAAKFWPARFGRYEPAVGSGFRRTQSVPDKTGSDERGVWFFGSVSVGQSYEVSFSRPGYDTQSFVVTPSADGKPIDLPVEMKPAKGIIRGTVTGPGGGLGNVKLQLTDGTLVFDSASASDGDVGTFAFTGISTPGTYSLLATAPGLGTEVVQVTLEEGEERGGVDIRMRAGVGSISGRVTEGGAPLGGVTLTASNGDTTVTTTSLTQGAKGTYLFPRLELGGRWTIEAKLDGYVTQTRLVVLTGNATGIDFAFSKQTGSIIGLVESSNGGPLPGVNIRVSRDDLIFESQSAVSPDPGSFRIRDLPPGTYLVELSRYDHEPTSTSVTIGPGQVADLGTLTLVFRPRPDITQNGGIDVQVVNSEGDPIGPSTTAPGATVRVFRSADNTLVAEQVGAADQSSFSFQPLPVGTYRIEVTRGVTYRLATRRVSVGPTGVVPVVIPIYLLGQVHGRLVDSFTGETLVDYDVQIRRLNSDGTTSIVQNLPVTVATPPKPMPDGSLQIRFETTNPPGLTSGQYEVAIDNPPPGYRIRPDQVLVPGQPPMQFQIRPDDDTPLDLGNILADRFPEIHGVVMAPRLDAAPAPGDPRPISFVPIDDVSLQLTLTCPGTNPADGLSVFELPEPVPPAPRRYAGSEITNEIPDPAGGLETFYIDPVDLEELDLFGACQMEVRAAGYTTKRFDLFIDAIRGQHSRIDRNVGMVRPRDIAGTAFWVDDGTPAPREIAASGVTVHLQGDAVTGLNPGSVPFTSDGSDPTPVREDIASVVTDAAGGWVFPGSLLGPPPTAGTTPVVSGPRQVFGEALYAFDLPSQYAARSIRLTVDENGKSATEVVPDPEPFALETSPTGDRVQLDAIGGNITGRLDIRTVKGSPGLPAVALTGFSAALTGANSTTAVPVVAGGNSTAQRVQATTVDFGVTPDPGTHQWTVTPPATPADGRPRFVEATAADLAPSAPFFQAPGTSRSPATSPELVKTFVEMGAMNVQVLDPDDVPIDGAVVAVSGPVTSVPVTVGSGADNVVAGLDVDRALGGFTDYTVSLTAASNPALDVTTATAQVFADDGTFIGTCAASTGNCQVRVFQGGQPRIRITVSRYGTFTGTVCGLLSDDLPLPATCAAPGGEQLEVGGVPPLVVTATRIARPTADATFCATETGPTVTAVASADGSFRFAGPPGYYEVTVSHPDHESIPNEHISQQALDLECLDFDVVQPPFPFPPIPFPPLYGGRPVYQLQNDLDRTLPDPWFLLRLRSDVTVNVFDDFLGPLQGPPTADASVAITPDGGTLIDCDPVTAGANPCSTGSTGRVVLAGANALLPGVYEVAVTKADYFPLTIRIEIRRGGGAVTINVPLPRTGGRIAGAVVAENSEGDALPAPVGVVVSDVYDQPDAVVSGATVLGANASPGVGDVPAVAVPPSLEATYLFDGLGSGVHRLSYAYDNSRGFYTDVPPNDVPVTVRAGPTPVEAADAVYTAANRDVVIVVSSARDVTGAVARLIDPDSGGVAGPPVVVGACPVTEPPIPAANRCATFNDLPPEIVSYRVLVAKELFATANVPFEVPTGASDLLVRVPLTLAGNTARVIGTAVNVENGASPPLRNAVAPGTTINLIRLPSTLAETTTAGGGGSFTFNITATGDYAIEAIVAGYASRRTLVTIDADDLGTSLDPPVVVESEKFATFTVTVSGTDLDVDAVTGVGLPTGTGAPATLAPTNRSGGEFTFSGDPAWSYRFRFTTTQGYAAVTVPALADPAFEPAVGAEEDVPVTMSPRTISGAVAGGVGGSVRLVSSGSTVVAGPATIVTSGAGAVYTIDGPIPAGSYTLVAERLSTGRGTLPVTVAVTDGNLTGQDITLRARDVAVALTTTPAAGVSIDPAGAGANITRAAGVTTPLTVPENVWPIDYTVTSSGYRDFVATGVGLAPVESPDTWNVTALSQTLPAVTLAQRRITGSVAGATTATVYAAAPGTDNAATGPSAGSAGAFTLTGPFQPGAYDVFAELLGTGWATTQVTFDSGDPDNNGAIDVGALTLDPRPVTVTFPGAPAGAAISVTPDGAATALTATAPAGVTVDEDDFPIAYRVSSPGRVDAASSAGLSSTFVASWDDATLAQTVPVTLAARTISGSVTGATGASVRARLGTTTIGNVATGAGNYTLTGPFPIGEYTLVAEQLGVGRGTLLVDIPSNATASPTGQAIPLGVRDIAVTFTVRNAPADTTITILKGATTIGTGVPGTAINIPETQFPGTPVTYRVTGGTFADSTGTIALADVTDVAGSWNQTAPALDVPAITMNPKP